MGGGSRRLKPSLSLTHCPRLSSSLHRRISFSLRPTLNHFKAWGVNTSFIRSSGPWSTQWVSAGPCMPRVWAGRCQAALVRRLWRLRSTADKATLATVVVAQEGSLQPLQARTASRMRRTQRRTLAAGPTAPSTGPSMEGPAGSGAACARCARSQFVAS